MVVNNRIEGNWKDGVQLEKTWINHIVGNKITYNNGKGISLMLSNNHRWK